MEHDLEHLRGNIEHLDREDDADFSPQKGLTIAGADAMAKELTERKDRLFNKRKLVNVILHRMKGEGLPRNFQAVEWPKLPKYKVMTEKEYNQITLPDLPLRPIVWKVLSCQDGIVAACLRTYNSQRRKLILGELKKIIEELPMTQSYNESQLRERASEKVGQVFPQLMTKQSYYEFFKNTAP